MELTHEITWQHMKLHASVLEAAAIHHAVIPCRHHRGLRKQLESNKGWDKASQQGRKEERGTNGHRKVVVNIDGPSLTVADAPAQRLGNCR